MITYAEWLNEEDHTFYLFQFTPDKGWKKFRHYLPRTIILPGFSTGEEANSAAMGAATREVIILNSNINRDGVVTGTSEYKGMLARWIKENRECAFGVVGVNQRQAKLLMIWFPYRMPGDPFTVRHETNLRDVAEHIKHSYADVRLYQSKMAYEQSYIPDLKLWYTGADSEYLLDAIAGE